MLTPERNATGGQIRRCAECSGRERSIALLDGEQDVWLASCGGFYASPHGEIGSPCPLRSGVCLECSTRDHRPQAACHPGVLDIYRRSAPSVSSGDWAVSFGALTPDTTQVSNRVLAGSLPTRGAHSSRRRLSLFASGGTPVSSAPASLENSVRTTIPCGDAPLRPDCDRRSLPYGDASWDLGPLSSRERSTVPCHVILTHPDGRSHAPSGVSFARLNVISLVFGRAWPPARFGNFNRARRFWSLFPESNWGCDLRRVDKSSSIVTKLLQDGVVRHCCFLPK